VSATLRTPPEARIGDVAVSAAHPAVIAPIVGTDLSAILDQAARIAATDVDLVEWRADHFAALGDPAAVGEAARRVRDAARRPVIFTIRSRAEGGAFEGDESTYVAALEAACAGGAVDAADIEHALPGAETMMTWLGDRGLTAIVSRHVLDATPPRTELLVALAAMEATPAAIVKLAVQANTRRDAETVMAALTARYRVADKPLIVLAMGAAGAFTRLAGPRLGCAATFVAVAGASAPGQPSLAELRRAWAALGQAE